MRYIDLFVRDHPNMDLQRAVLEDCPRDFGYKDPGPLCWDDPTDESICRACWEREAVEE